MNRREFIALTGAAAAGAVVLGAETGKEAGSRGPPNPYRSRWYDDFRPTDRFQELNEGWTVATVTGDRSDLWRRPSAAGEPVAIPQVVYSRFRERTAPKSKEIEVSWYRRRFVLDEKVRAARRDGDRVFLHFGGVAWRWSAWVNGQVVVESCVDVLNAQEIEVTALLRDDGENELLIAATDNHGLARELKHARLFDPKVNNDRVGDFIAPAPETLADPLVWGEVELWVRSATYVADVFVRPDWRNRRLHVNLEVAGPAGVAANLTVFDRQGVKQPVEFAAGRVGAGRASSPIRKLALSAEWVEPRVWEPEDPFLYVAEVTLTEDATGRILERRRVRFGFREIWIQGGDMMMNGKRLFLARHSAVTGHEHHVSSYSSYKATGATVPVQLAHWVKTWRELNTINSLRLHRSGFVRPGAFAAYADELGLMLVPEAGICMGDRFAVDLPEFWKNCQAYLAAWVRSGRNHPSIVIWSMSNEFLWCGAERKNPECPRLLLAQEELVNRLDPTRVASWDGDWDLPTADRPGIGPSATVNLHYPTECSASWWPAASWAYLESTPERPLAIRGFHRQFAWRPGSKPIGAGEYAWNQKNYFEGPANMTKYAGDLAYDWESWRTGRLQRRLVKSQSDAWRVARFYMLNPWTHDTELYFTLMPRETVVLRDLPTVHFAGRKVSLRAYLLNDTLRDRRYTVQWSVRGGAREFARATRSFEVAGGRMAEFPLEFEVPELPAVHDAELVVTLSREGRAINTETYPVRLRPPVAIAWPTAAVLFDPEDSTGGLWKGLGVAPRRAATLEEAVVGRAVVLGFGVYAGKLDAAGRRQLGEFVRRGGNVLTLGETGWPKTGASLPLALRVQQANHAWVRAPGHPALAGLADPDLGFWGAEQWVTTRAFAKPDQPSGAMWRTLVDVGSRDGLNWAAVVEVFDGSGRYLHNQLSIDQAVLEPGARATLAGLLQDVSRPAEPRRPVSAALGEAHWLATQLRAAHVRQAVWSESETANFLFVSAAKVEADPRVLANWVKRGGRVLLVDLAPENAARWAAAIPGGFTLRDIKPYDGARLVERGPGMWGISNEEFFWCEGVWSGGERGTSEASPRGPAMSQLARLASCALEGPRLQHWLQPAVWSQVTAGRGSWLLTTINFPAGLAHCRKKTVRLVQALLANLGIEAETQRAAVLGDFRMLRLRSHASRGFQDEAPGDGKGGWTDQGFLEDLHFFPQNISGYDLANLPQPVPPPEAWPSPLELGGVPFEIIDPRTNGGKTCLVLAPQGPIANEAPGGDYRSEALDIAVGATFDLLCSVHASAFLRHVQPGEILWKYVLRYEDGSTAELPVRANIESADWQQPQELSDAEIAWLGPSMRSNAVCLYLAKLANPEPRKTVRSIDIIAGPARGVSAVVALTTAARRLE